MNLSYNDLTGSVSQDLCNLKKSNLNSFKVDCHDVNCICCDGCAGTGLNAGGDDPMVNLRAQKIGVKAYSISTRLDVEPQARNQALGWIIEDDELNLTADSESLEERYILAVFYFALGGQNWTIKTKPWLSNNSHCSWFGVVCDDNENIEALHLCKFLMFKIIVLYAINKYLFSLANALRKLHFTDKASLNLKGQIPYELGKIDKLMVLNLSNNGITGFIPDDFR